MKQSVLRLASLSIFFTAIACADDTFLGKTPNEWSTQLASPQDQQRVEAAWAIAQIMGQGQKEAFYSAIWHPLIVDRDPSVRYWGAQGLAMYAKRVGDKGNGFDFTLKALESLIKDKSAAPRIAAAEALGQLGQADKALPILVAAMDDPQDSTRIQAVAALEKLGSAARPAMPTLEKATSDSSEYVKRISERALTSLDANRTPTAPKAKGKKAKAKAISS